jgi:hypothetical protein
MAQFVDDLVALVAGANHVPDINGVVAAKGVLPFNLF